MDTVTIAAAFRALADAFEAELKTPEAGGPAPGVVTTAPKPRGRPKKEEAPAVEAPDPFAEAVPVQTAPPVATLEEVRAALTTLRSATDQATALKVLKEASGADNLTALTADKYGLVVAAAQRAFPAPPTATVAAVVEIDPFAEPASEPAKVLTLEDVKAAVVNAQKRTGQDAVMRVVMAHGGKAADPQGGGVKPSLKALPPSEFAATVKELGELPSTK